MVFGFEQWLSVVLNGSLIFRHLVSRSILHLSLRSMNFVGEEPLNWNC
jgi:hypothetical protein